MSNASGSSSLPSSARAGLLLVNLGSPDAPTPAALRRYLAEFLADPRVVEQPRWLWLPLLHGVILRVRPARSAAAYREIWTEEGSPLIAISRRQEAALREALADAGVEVALAMRYGAPSVRDGLRALRQAGCERMLVLPLYPQYSATTTASVFDAVADELKQWRRVPALRFVDGYHAHPAYIAALAARIRAHRERHGRGERLLISFHGIPERYAKAGDPYPEQCAATARLLREALGLDEHEAPMSFQSRFGREPWLSPYTDETLQRLAGEGVRSVDVVCPGFAADCLETLEEIAMQNRDVFLAAGGEAFRYIPALNDDPAHVRALAGIAREQMADWLGDQPA